MARRRSRSRRRRPEVATEATYVCDSCGEEIVVPLDITAGERQEYVEDCPVCCHPMVLRIEFDDSGDATVDGEHE
jgi:transcription elongation factor Elf1